MTRVIADISKDAQKDTAEDHTYLIRSSTQLFVGFCVLYPTMLFALLTMVSEAKREFLIEHPPPWVSATAVYAVQSYFAVIVVSHVFKFVHGHWSTTHHAITKCTEMVNGRDTTEVRGLFGSTKTTGGTLNNFLFMCFLLVLVVAATVWSVLYAINYKVDNAGSWGAQKIDSLGTGLWGLFAPVRSAYITAVDTFKGSNK